MGCLEKVAVILMSKGRFRFGYRNSYRASSGIWVPGGITTYAQKVLSIQPANLIAYWPLNETSGTAADNAEGTAARDGTYSSDVSTWPVATGIGDGNTAPVFDGTNDYVNIYSASLNSAFNGAEGSLLMWWKVADWTDATLRLGVNVQVSSTYRIYIQKDNQNPGRLWIIRSADSDSKGVIVTAATHGSPSGYFHIGVTWSESGDAVKCYLFGSQTGSTQTSINAWSGSLNSSGCVIGAASITPANPFSGNIAHVSIFGSALSAGDILSLATV